MSVNKETIQQLNDLMTEYSCLKEDRANRARCIALKNQAATIVYSPDFRNELVRRAAAYIRGKRVLGDVEDCVQEAFVDVFEEYDHKKNDNFYLFLIVFLRNYASKLTEKEYEHVKNEGGSLDDPDIGYKFTSHKPDMSDAHQRFEKFYTELLICVIRISPSKYYPAFAVEYYINLCREHLNSVLDINENEAFNEVMDVEFADYVLVKPCRSFNEIECTPCKYYADFGLYPNPNAKNPTKWVGRLEIPFENRIYGKFFGVKDPTVNGARKEFCKKLGIPVPEKSSRKRKV